MKVLAVIPARGGSKGVPGKNRKVVDGKPLIAYTIESALESKLLSDVYVSSDDEAILEIAKGYSKVKIHTRPADLATDSSPVTDTMAAVKNIEAANGNVYDALMILQPTAPLRKGSDIDNAIAILSNDNTVNTVISVCEMHDVHPARMYWKKNDSMISILPEYEQTRRQDIPPALYRNGSMYLIRSSAFERQHSFMVKPIAPLVMPSDWLLNIDEPRDMLIAEALIPAWKLGKL